MRLTSRLVHIAALLAASGCGGATITAGEGPGDSGSGSDAAGEGGGGIDSGHNPGDSGYNPGDSGSPPVDAAGDAIVDDVVAPDANPDVIVCGGCGCTAPPPTHTVSAAQACELLEEEGAFLVDISYGATCTQFCGQYWGCELPSTFVMQVQALNPDGGVPSADGGPSTLQCPSTPATMTVTCLQMCTGRLTAGYAAPGCRVARDEGERLAAMAYLEAVSVHAFHRLERELAAHGGPPSLLRDARRARRDEVRHTAMTARLARSRGASPRLPDAAARSTEPVRPLFEVALENAVEGCVRETYGAVLGLVEAQASPDAELRRAMRSIAADECRHAELAWAVHAWALPRLSSAERERVDRAMRDAIAEIAGRDPRAASLLFPETGPAGEVHSAA
jgi:hypothetical protein